jgi:hypothetical protein
VLGKIEARRTLNAYEQTYGRDLILCKPYKCGKCEYRATKRDNAYRHIRQVHRVEFNEAKRLVKVLPLDEAEKTVGDFNKKFADETGRCYIQWRLKTDGKTGSVASNSPNYELKSTELFIYFKNSLL